MIINGQEYWTTKQVAEYLELSEGRVRQLKKAGVFQNIIQFSNRTLILVEDVKKYAEDR